MISNTFNKKINPNTPLSGLEYVIMPTVMLVRHPEYSVLAYRIVNAILKMTTEELETINLKLEEQ